MKFYRKAEETAKQIVNAFREPEKLPAALAPVFVRRKDNVPCRSWSWSNQFIVAIHGHSDARGFRQWQEAGRHVKKGEHCFQILCPCVGKREAEDEETGETRTEKYIYGFTTANVFGLSQTDGEPLPVDHEAEKWIESLPLLEVARSWDLTVQTYNGRELAALGRIRYGESIALGVENLSTWAHEMLHAADYRLGNATLAPGQQWDNETVAEFGGAVLLQCLGRETDADFGGCWQYVNAYARNAGIELITACERVLKRTCDAVALILDTAEELQQAETIVA